MNKAAAKIVFIFCIFKQKFWSLKTGIIMFLLYFVMYVFLAPIKQFSIASDYKSSPWIFPFLITNMYFLFTFMTFVVYYFSNVPFMQKWGMYQMIRIGRMRWAFVQMISIFLSALGFIIIAILLSIVCLIPQIQLESGWGKVIYSLALTDASEQYMIPVDFRYEFIKSSTPIEAMVQTLLIGCLVITFLGMIMFAASICFNRLCAILTAMIFVVMPIVTENMAYFIRKLPWFSPISWLRVTRIGGKDFDWGIMPDSSFIIGALIIMIISLSIIILWRVRTVDFQWNSED